MENLSNHPYSLEEYYAIERAVEVRHEYMDGRIITRMGSSIQHNMMVSNLSGQLFGTIDRKQWHTFTVGMRVKVSPYHYAYPDMVICSSPSQIEKIQGLESLTQPVVIIEVMSPATRYHDCVDKRKLYMQMPSIKELVFASEYETTVEHYVRQTENQWTFQLITTRDLTLHLDSVGADIYLDEVYEDLASS